MSLPWTAQSGQCCPKIRGGGIFFEPLYLKNGWRYENGHGSIRSSSAPFLNRMARFCRLSFPHPSWLATQHAEVLSVAQTQRMRCVYTQGSLLDTTARNSFSHGNVVRCKSQICSRPTETCSIPLMMIFCDHSNSGAKRLLPPVATLKVVGWKKLCSENPSNLRQTMQNESA